MNPRIISIWSLSSGFRSIFTIIVERFGAKNTKASQAQSKRKQIQRIDKLDAPGTLQARVSFQFPSPERSGSKVIELRDIWHAYGENVVYKGIDYTVERNQRTVFVGPNG